MTSRIVRWGCLLGAGLVVVLAVSVGAWWFLQNRPSTSEVPAASSVLVFLVSPSSGDEVTAGDLVPVSLQATAATDIARSELFVDGTSIGVVTDDAANGFWTWQAWPAGIHSLRAVATAADGETGESQTVILNVLPGDEPIVVPADEGQSLAQVGAPFGVSPEDMAAANPKVDPAQPLPGGQPVKVPPGGGPGPGTGPSLPSGDPGVPFLITWEFQPTSPVDKAYCYASSGDSFWHRLPEGVFTYFSNLPQTDYTGPDLELMKDDDGEIPIQVECWGWVGEVLKFLGSGGTKYSAQDPAGEVMIATGGFTLIGQPQFPIEPEDFTGGGGKIVPPPFALREPESTAECAQHYGNALALFVCDTLLNASVQQYRVLEWEWAPKVCWPGYCQWANDIDGYLFYVIDPSTKVAKYLKTIANPNQKVTAVPLPWGAVCYGVIAYVDDPAIPHSQMATYCPGETPETESVTLSPTDWLTTGGQWLQDGDCDTYGGADTYVLANKNTGFGNNPEVLVGSYIVDDEDEDCYREGDYSGAVRFLLPVLPTGAVLQQATLRFSDLHTDYGATGYAANSKDFCAAGVGRAKQDWTTLGGPTHFVGKNLLFGLSYNSPYASLPPGDGTPEVDVTSLVASWIQHPSQNFGFVLAFRSPPLPVFDGTGECLSQIGNFQLEIQYFAP